MGAGALRKTKRQFSASANFAVDRYLFHWVTQVEVLYRNKMRLALRRIRLSIPAWRSLAILANYGPMNTTKLAQFTVVERTALTRVVQTMVRAGLLQKAEAKDDRRSSYLSITAQGRAKYAEALATVEKVYRSATLDIDPKRIEEATELMIALARNIGGIEYQLLTDMTD